MTGVQTCALPICKVCYVTAMAALGELGVQTRVISTYAPEPIKRHILPRVATGEAILADRKSVV